MPDGARVGVIGVGFGARVHIPAFQSEGLEVVAVCARRSERAREAAERFGIPQAFTDYREMLQMDGLDAVSVAGPASPNFHDGFRCQQVLDAVRESSAAGQVVQIELEE